MAEIDVSGCEHFIKYDKKKPICRSGGCQRVYKSCLCAENIDCHYRQLKRLEFENKLLKADYEASEAENAKLKEKLEKIEEIINKLPKEHITIPDFTFEQNINLIMQQCNQGYVDILDIIEGAEE